MNINTPIFIEEDWFENVVCKMAAMLRPQCVKAWMSNYIPIFDMGVIMYLCVNPDAGLVNACQ